MAYATSTDRVRWQRPDLGQADRSDLTEFDNFRFQGDDLDATWILPENLRIILKGQPVRLRISLKNADLYTVTL